MANFVICSFLFRLVLPLIMLSCIVFRPSGLSAVYLFLTLISATVPIPTKKTMSGSTGAFLKILITISLLGLLAKLAFHMVLLLKYKPYGHILINCEFLERLLRTIGFVRLDHLDPNSVVLWIIPEIGLLVASIVFHIVFSKIVNAVASPEEEGFRTLPEPEIPMKKQNYKLMMNLGKAIVIASMCMAAIIKPSIPGGLYFLVFLCSCTWLGCYKSLGKGFAVILKCLMAVVFLQIFALFAYQNDWSQIYLKPETNYARWFGLYVLMFTSCDEDPRVFEYADKPWTDFANGLILMIFYFAMATVSKQLFEPKLMQEAKNVRKYSAATSAAAQSGLGATSILQDSTGSVIVSNVDPENDIPMKDIEPKTVKGPTGKSISVEFDDDENPGCFVRCVYVLEALLAFIIQTSYIFTNIIMMAWSITYHSWITFVLLLWASILWMVPNQRKFMLRCSPFLVFYAWFLLVATYAYSMDLTEEELPTKIDWVDLAELGFVRNTDLPYKVLLVKCLYTCMFWITLRQYMKERQEERQNSALADMVAPLQVTVGAATGVDHVSRLLTDGQKHQKVYPEKLSEQAVYLAMNPLDDNFSAIKSSNSDQGVHKATEEGNEGLRKVGRFAKKLLTKFWIWVVAITLFFVAITGERMTSFRILYMTLFLVFLLSFQINFNLWRRMMFGFWLTVIIYSMIILVMVYTYQFDNFKGYWSNYLHVSEQQQLDIGLEKYQTKQLFVRLVTPTFFVIIAVIQLHYFHKDFMEMSKPVIVDTTKSEAASSFQGGAIKYSESVLEPAPPPLREGDNDEDSVEIDLTDLENVSVQKVQQKFKRFMKKTYEISNLVWLFMELHAPKIVLLVIFFCVVKDICAINFAIVVLMVLGATLGSSVLRICALVSSLIASVLLLTRMVYQIQYINHGNWNVTCDFPSAGNTSVPNGNTNEWLGYYKIANGRDFPNSVVWNITLIMAVTVWCVIKARQDSYRASLGRPNYRSFFMFPKVRVSNADKHLVNYFKYLANYFFYRMGVEVCLIFTVLTIGMRMDLYAFLYSIFLLAFFKKPREELSKCWNIYLVFLAVVIPIQFFMVIGLPPGLCLDFPWENSKILRGLQDWAYLMDFPSHRPSPKKILCDFVLLILVARQSLVFRIEHRYKDEDYSGGNNGSILHNADDPTFQIPIPDFVTYSRNYLDIFKRITMLPLIWITLAIVFLAGANRVNLFSLGYLLGSFYFLWIGTDIYLRPIPVIIKKWNYLIMFNVFVIFLKTILQFLGCLFFDYLKADTCWLVQLLAISCLRKFKTPGLPGLAAAPPIPGMNDCEVPREYVGLAWDGACFAFLILQRRLFNSYNFFHMINETKASAILASRGAELIEELRQKRMSDQALNEKRIIDKIKSKMEKIKAAQIKFMGPSVKEAINHRTETGSPELKRPMYRRKNPNTYKEAVRSGDYYMFDEMDNEGLEDYEEIAEPDEDMDRKKGPLVRTVAELLNVTVNSGVATALRQRRMSYQPTRRHDLESQISVPFSAPPAIGRTAGVGLTFLHESLEAEPEASTSRMDVEPEEVEKSQAAEPQSKVLKRHLQSLVNGILFIFAFLQSFMYSCSRFLYKFSKDHRYVLKVLSSEKKVLKEGTMYRLGNRHREFWEPAYTFEQLMNQACSDRFSGSDDNAGASGAPLGSGLTERSSAGTPSPSASYVLIVSGSNVSSDRQGRPAEPNMNAAASELSLKKEESSDNSPYYTATQERCGFGRTWGIPEIRILAPSDESVSLPCPTFLSPRRSIISGRRCSSRCSDSENLSSSCSDESQKKEQEMSSADQPVIYQLILSIWFLLLGHSDLLCYFIIFLNQIKNATFISLPLPLMVFLWGSLTVPRPSKSFWVTIIAYTQIIVVIKCMFQFRILPWNRDDFAGALDITTMIGIERKKNYALWDLILLLVVYFHKFMLKCLGLWQHTSEPSHEVLHDGHYLLKEGQVVPLNQNDLDERRRNEQQNTNQENNDEEVVLLSSVSAGTTEAFPSSLKMMLDKHKDSVKQFFVQLFDPTSRVSVDVYSFMFLCDFFNFFVILLGYSSFGAQQGDVTSYLADNRVPVMFLLMLILQFIIIIVDRAIFLRKNIFAKIVFQFLQIFMLHIWLFILFPYMTERNVNSVLPPQMYYMVKCFYLLLAAYQIRCGYPARILGNFVCKSYGIINMALFKVFMLIPFLFELRSVMDWMWTDTSMTVFDWIKMEDIFAHVYQLKCARHLEDEYPQPRGCKKKPLSKYIMGAGLLGIIIGLIWFPLVFFSLGNAVGEANPPYDVTLSLRLGPYEPLYQTSAQSNSIFQLNSQDYSLLLQRYEFNRMANTFLGNYDFADIAAVKLSFDSATVWSISPPDRERMLEEVESPNKLRVHMQVQISHKSNTKEDSGVTRNEIVLEVPALVDNQTNPVREGILQMLQGKMDNSTPPVILSHIIPKFMKVTSRGVSFILNEFMDPFPEMEDAKLRNVSLKLSGTADKQWWEVIETTDDHNYKTYLQYLPYADPDALIVYTFNDKIFPATLNMITGGGIIGLYTTMVLVASRLLRGFFSEICFKIMFEDLPYVDRVLQLCLDIYLVREAGEFSLEEDLFAKLVFLYRSPETLIKWTRPIEEVGEDEDDDDIDDDRRPLAIQPVPEESVEEEEEQQQPPQSPEEQQ